MADEGDMTLVFAVSALGRLAAPDRVFADARGWSEYVGVVGDDPGTDASEAVERAGLDPDVVSGDAGASGSLAAIRQRYATDRHVFVGTGPGRETAEALGWEYLPVEEAAGEAGWTLDPERTDEDGNDRTGPADEDARPDPADGNERPGA